MNPIEAFLIGLDEALNGLSGGDPHHTISFRAAVASLEGREWGHVVCHLLDAIDSGHCERALEHERRPDCGLWCKSA